MGMMVDFHAIASRYVLAFGLVYTVAAILGKIAGCGLPALFLNFNFRGALRVGLGMAPRGEVALIIAGIGLSSGVLQQDVLGVVVLMVFITMLVAPGLLSASLRSEKTGVRKERHIEKRQRYIVFNMPTPETADLVLRKIISAFYEEGFYVQRIDTGKRDRLYQIRKDKTFVVLNASSESLQFDCQEADVVYIHTLVYEILVELENTMKDLKRLTDRKAMGKNIFKEGNGKVVSTQGFLKHIHPNALKFDLEGNTKSEIIEDLLNLLVTSAQIKKEDYDEVLRKILEREVTMSTGMEHGIAMPHAKVNSVRKLVCAVGIKKVGIDFGSIDGVLSKIFVMILSPRDAAGPHIRFMADMSQLLMDKARREKLLLCKNNTELYNAIVS